MKTVKTLLASLLLSAMLLPMLTVPVMAATPSTINFSEDFESYSENSIYPSNKLWVANAQFPVKTEGDNHYLRMSYYEANKDAALAPFQGTITSDLKSILVRMDLRPVYLPGNGMSLYDFRVRNFSGTDSTGHISGKWKTFFRLNVAGPEDCYLAGFLNSSITKIPLMHDEWNTILVSFDLIGGSYTVSVGETTAYCDLGIKNFAFPGNQLQFNQLVKGDTFAASQNTANYVDIDNIKIVTPTDVSRFDNLFTSNAKTELRADKFTSANTLSAGIRFLSELNKPLMQELLDMKKSGEARSVTVGTLIAPSDYLTHVELTNSIPDSTRINVQNDLNNLYLRQGEEDTTAYIAGSISKLMAKNLGRDFTARAYVDVLLATGQHFTVYGPIMETSARELAIAAPNTANKDKHAMLTTCKNSPAFKAGEEIRLMSYNVYYPDLREARMKNVADLIKLHMPDVMGLQEVVDGEWKNYLIKSLGENYECVGHGREEGATGEGTPIFYRKDKYTLLEEDTFWLSNTPYVWSKHPGSRQSRIFTYVLLSRNSDGKKFAVVNTHLDTSGADIRNLQLQSLFKQLDVLGLDKYPIFITGDMNATRGSASGEIDIILNEGYTDSMDVALYRSPDLATIDFCFVQDQHALVTQYLCDTRKYNGEKPSDHSPVIIDIRLK